ncbi:hypothetical protein [Azospirillum palustre]
MRKVGAVADGATPFPPARAGRSSGRVLETGHGLNRRRCWKPTVRFRFSPDRQWHRSSATAFLRR